MSDIDLKAVTDSALRKIARPPEWADDNDVREWALTSIAASLARIADALEAGQDRA